MHKHISPPAEFDVGVNCFSIDILLLIELSKVFFKKPD